ncbi:MAG: hypothetical protein ALAOOOJD_01175 [bacterium]|nr:hypothetical protein [bacterium]
MPNAEAVKFLEEKDAAFLATVAGVDQITSERQPSPGEWSVGEIVHHLTLIERTVRRLVWALRWRLVGSPARPGIQKTAAMEKVGSREGRVKTMQRFLPSHGQSLQRLLESYKRERQKTLQLARRANFDKLRQRAFRHYVLGYMNGEEWLLFNGYHQERHRRQIEEVLQRVANKT